MSVERSLVLCKPDAVLIRQAGISIVEKIMSVVQDCKLLCFEHHIVTAELATQHYEEHVGKSFFPSLLRFITNPCGVIVMVFEGIDAIKTIRTAIGPTMVEKAVLVDSLRGKYGHVAGINCYHASDAPETGLRESKLWTEYYKVDVREEVAKQHFDEYKAKYDGKYNTDMTQVREVVNKILALEDEYVKLIRGMSDCDDNLIKGILSVIIQDHDVKN